VCDNSVFNGVALVIAKNVCVIILFSMVLRLLLQRMCV